MEMLVGTPHCNKLHSPLTSLNCRNVGSRLVWTMAGGHQHPHFSSWSVASSLSPPSLTPPPLSPIGFCCAYLIFISENLHSVFPRVSQLVTHPLSLPLLISSSLPPSPNLILYVCRLVYLFSLLPPLVFLCNLRHLKHLAPFRYTRPLVLSPYNSSQPYPPPPLSSFVSHFFSLFADFATIFAYGIVFYFDMEHFHLLQYALTTTKYRGNDF